MADREPGIEESTLPEWMRYTDPQGVDAAAGEEARLEEEEARNAAKKKKEELEQNQPSIDNLPPPGIEKGELERADPIRVKSWQEAISPEDATEERKSEKRGRDGNGDQSKKP